MRLGCPHCAAWFDVADERAADPAKSVTCPECLEVFAVREAKHPDASTPSVDDEADFGFELDGLSRAGLSRAGFEETGMRSAEPSRISLSNVIGERSAPGFDVHQPESTGEVSSLRDVDLTLAGTYHRTGRKLHHATDVVWTGRGKEAPPAAPPTKLPPIVTTSKPPSTTSSFAGPFPTVEPSRKPTSRVPEPSWGAPRSGSKSPADPGADFAAPGFDDFPPIEASVMGNSARLGSEADDMSMLGFEGSLGAPSAGPRSNAPVERSAGGDRFSMGPQGSSIAGKPQSGAMDDMDFSSLLEDSLSSKSAFGRDNPFAEIGLGDPAGGTRSGGAPPAPEPIVTRRSAGRSEPVAAVPRPAPTEASAFFVDAPAAGASPSMVQGIGDSGGSSLGGFDVDIPAGEGPRPADPKKGAKGGKPGKAPARPAAGAKSSKGPVIALVALVVIAGAGVAGQALGHGYFFMGLLDSPREASAPPGGVKPPPPAERLTAGEPKPGNTATGQPVPPGQEDLPLLGQTPASYDARIAAIDKAAAAEQDAQKKLVLDDLSLQTQLEFRYRWPGRFMRDEARKATLEAKLASVQKRSFMTEFWDTLVTTPTPEKTREALLDHASLSLTKASAELTPSQTYFYQGLVAHERKKPADALQLYDLTVKDLPAHAWAQLERATVLLEDKKFDEAAAAAESVLTGEETSHDARLILARTIIARQDETGYGRAKDIAEAAQKAAKEASDAYGEYEANLVRAQVYGLLNKNDERRAALEAASAFDPKDETLVIALAEADERAGDMKKAAERLTACPSDVCKSLDFMRKTIKVLKATDNLQEAENRTVQAEKDFPRDAEVFFLSADVLEQRGKLSLAAKKYELVRQKDPKYLEAYLRLAAIHRREKAFDKALGVLDAAAKVFEGTATDSEAALALAQERGELLIKQGRADEAKEVFTQIVKAQPTNAPARLSLATLLVGLGQPGPAVQHFEKLYELGKVGPEVSLPYAEALIASGKPDRAIEEIKAFLETNPKDLEALVKLGHAYVQKERFEEAMAVLEHAVAINRNFAPAYFYAGLAEFGRQRRRAEEVEKREKAGETIREDEKPDWEKAVQALTNARDRDPENLYYREMLARALTENGKKRDLLSALEQYDTIITAYRKADRATSKLAPSAEVYYNRGLLASKLGRPRDEVLKNFQDALLLDSERADYIARYGEELYRLQARQQQGDAFVLEAKAYFQLVREQYNKQHVRSNYYLGKIALLEWGKQSARRPNDPLHKEALAYFQQVVAANGQNEFPDVYFQIGNIFRDLDVTRLADQNYDTYLSTYRAVYNRPAPNERYVRELMKH